MVGVFVFSTSTGSSCKESEDVKLDVIETTTNIIVITAIIPPTIAAQSYTTLIYQGLEPNSAEIPLRKLPHHDVSQGRVHLV
jgi:hypothetical protein